MNNIVMTKAGNETRFVAFQENEIAMLRTELEMMLEEDTRLKKIVGAAALFISRLEGEVLPKGTVVAGLALARLIDEMPDDTMCEALQLYQAN